jgi:flavorubredoxin
MLHGGSGASVRAMTDTRIVEIADGIHQLTTYLEEIDFGVNQYLVAGDEPLLFHTGMRSLFPQVLAAVATVVAPVRLRWVSFGHVEADECGSMNDWLAAAPQATVAHGTIGCMVSVQDLADRPAHPLADGDVLDIGGHRLRWIDTPHVPHAWEAGLLYDETTKVLFCGDLFSQWGPYPATTEDDIAARAIDDEDSSWLSLAPTTGDTVRGLAGLDTTTLAQMHGPAYAGDCPTALRRLAADFDRRIAAAGAPDALVAAPLGAATSAV